MNQVLAGIRKWIDNSSSKQKLTAGLTVIGVLATAALMSMGGTSGVAQDPLGSTTFYFISAFVKLMVVLLLIVGSALIFRRWLQTGSSGKPARQMRLVETIRLSPKQAIHLVVIGEQKLLIGATDQNVALISPIEDNLSSVLAEETQPQPILDFGSMFRSINLSAGNTQAKE